MKTLLFDFYPIFDFLKLSGTPEIKEDNQEVFPELFLKRVREIEEEFYKEKLNKDALAEKLVKLSWLMGKVIYRNDLQEHFSDQAKKVKDSYFSRFCKTLPEALKSKKAYEDGTHPDLPNKKLKNVIISSTRAGHYTLTTEKGQVLKSINSI